MDLIPFLRWIPEHRHEVNRDLEEAKDAALRARTEGNSSDLLRSLGRVGNACWMLGRTEEARASLREALEIAVALERPQDAVVMKLRLGIAWQYGGDGKRAEQIFREALEECQVLSFYEDFARQHLGKLLVELGKPGEARPHFERALKLRLTKGDPSLIRSTQEALHQLDAQHGQE